MLRSTAKEKSDRPLPRRVFRFLLALFVVYVGISLVLENVPIFARYQHYVIVTGSMSPEIEIGDVVLIDTKKAPSELEAGDIIAFEVEISGRDVVVVHYVNTVDDSDGLTFTTIANNTETPDDWVLSDTDIIGDYTLRIPRLGRFLLFSQSPVGRAVIFVDIIILYVVYQMLFKSKNNT